MFLDAVSIYGQLAFAIYFDQKIMYLTIYFDAVSARAAFFDYVPGLKSFLLKDVFRCCSIWAACFGYIPQTKNFLRNEFFFQFCFVFMEW